MLVGGKGTRSADPGIAKVAQKINGISLMSYHRDLLNASSVKELIIVSGHLHDQVQALVDSLDWYGLEVRVIRESAPRGTVSAVEFATHDCDSEEFVVILGDILMSFPLDDFLESWRATKKNVAVIVHPSMHMGDSDAVVVQVDGSVSVVPKGLQAAGVLNSYSAGLFGVTRGGLRRYAHSKCVDIGSNLLPKAAAKRDLFAYVSSHYFKDTGTPDRLADAVSDVQLGVFARRGDVNLRPALFLDRDGVMNPAQQEVYHPKEYKLMSDVPVAIARANRKGIPVFIVTNQPGIAKGFMSPMTHQEIRARMDELLAEHGAFVDDYFYCPHHPNSGFEGEVSELKIECECRKPNIGMITQARNLHGIDVGSSVMVGDMWRDQELALRSGMHFIHVTPACSLTNDHECFAEAAHAIAKGVDLLQC